MPNLDPAATPRLVRVEAIYVRVPFRRPMLDATGEFTHRRSWILRIVDEGGNQGLGEAALNPFAEEVSTDALARLMRALPQDLAHGRLPAWPDMAAEGEPGRAAMAAVEGAMGALEAARNGGASPAPVAVGAVIGFAGPDAGADAAAQAVELGFETLKIRAGFERTTDQLVDRVRAIRGAVGPGPRLRVDVAGAWDMETAEERMFALEPFRIEFVEQPLAAWDIGGHATLRSRVEVPIALDESIDSEYSVGEALAGRAADVLIVKPARVGGSAVTLRIAEAAAAAGVGVALATYYETGVGIAAALRLADALRNSGAGRGGERPAADPASAPAHALATSGLLVHDLLEMPLAIERGRMEVPAALTLDESQVDRDALERVEARG
ncbi:MAG TPA: mandelate racemase/muconate lactonizing enzyme family protein [Candidatus Limnocylindrales bacterium]